MMLCHRADLGTTHLVSHRVEDRAFHFAIPSKATLHYSVASNPNWQTGGSSSHMHRGLIENPEPSISINTYGMLPGYSKNKPWLSGGHSSWGISDVFFPCYWISLQPGMWGLCWSNHFPIFYKDDLYAGIISVFPQDCLYEVWALVSVCTICQRPRNLSHELCLCALQCSCNCWLRTWST